MPGIPIDSVCLLEIPQPYCNISTKCSEDLKLDILFVIYPGRRVYVIDEKIQVLPLKKLYSII